MRSIHQHQLSDSPACKSSVAHKRSNPPASLLQVPSLPAQLVLGMQGDAESEEEEEAAAEGADDAGEGDEDEELSPLVCIH